MSTLSAQITFQKTYNYFNGPDDSHSAMTKTSDNGFILTGWGRPTSFPAFYISIYLLKIDSVGNVVWNKEINDTTIAYYPPHSIKLCADGGFILCGYAVRTGANFDLYLIRTDSIGNKIWSMIYGEELMGEYGTVAMQTNDGGFVTCGTLYDSISKCLIVKTDANGIVEWSKEINDANSLYGCGASFISQTSDNGFIISGTCNDSNSQQDGYNSLLIKIDSAGNTQWFRKYGTSMFDQFKNVYQTADGGYIAGGDVDTLNDATFNPLFLLAKTDSTGMILWAKTFGGDGTAFINEFVMSTLIPVSDGGYHMIGVANVPSYNNLFSLKADSNGNYLWSKTHGHIDTDRGIDMIETSDGGFFITGMQGGTSCTICYDSSFLYKTDSYGNSFCNDSIPITLSADINFPLLPSSYIENTHDTFYSALMGDTAYSMSLGTICFNTGVNDIASTKHGEFSLFPNPANNFIIIHYNLSSSNQTKLSLFNLYGQKLKAILNETQPAGDYDMKIDIKDLEAGIYFVKMIVDGKEETRKIFKFK